MNLPFLNQNIPEIIPHRPNFNSVQVVSEHAYAMTTVSIDHFEKFVVGDSQVIICEIRSKNLGPHHQILDVGTMPVHFYVANLDDSQDFLVVKRTEAMERDDETEPRRKRTLHSQQN
eukprot:scaffold12795_cov36-Attheya_sp.AAC.2